MLVNIISAIGKNGWQALLVRDCGIETPLKVKQTYDQNKKYSPTVANLAARERFIDEYAVAAVWLGGISAVERIANRFIKMKNFAPEVSAKLFNEDNLQGISKNIEKFKEKAPEAVKDLINAQNNGAKYKKLCAWKMAAALTIPIALMGFVIPKLVFASTSKKINACKERQISQQQNFEQQEAPGKDIAFGNGFVSALSGLSYENKMAVIDGGYAVGRLATARDSDEFSDITFKMACMMFLNFVAPKYIIAPSLEKFAEDCFNVDTRLNLDMLADKEFRKQIKNGDFQLPKSSEAADILEFIDKNPNSMFARYSGVEFLKDKKVRDPRVLVDVKALEKYKKTLDNFVKSVGSAANPDKFLKKACGIKGANILVNVCLSSFMLAIALPQIRYMFRERVLGTGLMPGIAGEFKRKGVEV